MHSVQYRRFLILILPVRILLFTKFQYLCFLSILCLLVVIILFLIFFVINKIIAGSKEENCSDNLVPYKKNKTVQLSILKEHENLKETFTPATTSENNDPQEWCSDNLDSSFYEENYVELLDSIDPNFAEIRDIELDILLDRVDKLI